MIGSFNWEIIGEWLLARINYLVNLILILFVLEFFGEIGSGFFVVIDWFIRVFRDDRLDLIVEVDFMMIENKKII